jgi:hypothetical protein
MIADEVWLPASGCFPCPFEISLPQSWGTINPLPGIANPRRGYFCVPLNTWYLPIQSCLTFGQFAIGEINAADLNLFSAIAFHELEGHGKNNEAFFEFPRKQFLRILAAEAYKHLQEIMEKGQHEEFRNVYLSNAAIAAISRSMVLVEELFATLFGVESLREENRKENFIPSHVINRIEDQFVANHSKPNYFGPEFQKLYARVSQLYHKFGPVPLRLIAFFAVGHAHPADMALILYGIEEQSEKRLHQALEFLEHLLPIRLEWGIFTGEEWFKLLYNHLPGFKECVIDHRHFVESFKPISEQVRERSANFDDWNPLHPFFEGNRVLISVAAPTSSPQLMIPSELIRRNANALPEVVCNLLLKEAHQKFLNAQANNRTLVFLYNEEYESSVSVPGFGLVPAAVEDALMPGSVYTPTWDLSSITEDAARFKEWKRREDILMSKMGKLRFYEALRQQVDARCGLQCPLGGILDQPCCGEGKLLLELFKAGQKAAAEGWHYTKWEMPKQCQGSPDV